MWHGYNEGQTAVFSIGNPMQDDLFVYFSPSAATREDPAWMLSFRWQNPQLPTPLAVIRHPTTRASRWTPSRRATIGTNALSVRLRGAPPDGRGLGRCRPHLIAQ